MLNWSTHQLTEFFCAVSTSADEASAIARAVEQAAEMVEAEVGAVLLAGEVRTAWGFGRDVPVAALLRRDRMLAVSGLGELHTVYSLLGDETAGTLVVGRLGHEFTPEERQMLQGMAQVLGMALRSIRVLSEERSLRADKERQAESAKTRQRLVETLLTIQREISNRRPLTEILDAVTGGAALLLGSGRSGGGVALMLAEGGRGRRLTLSSTSGEMDPAGSDVEAREAMATGSVLIRPTATGTVIAAPVRVTGEMAGSLVAHLPGAAEQYTEQRDQLAAFAQQVSLALADARTVEAVHEAHHDAVTGLPNRALFLKIFRRVLAARGTATDPTSVLFIDLDRFKAVNDSLGHGAGDQLLAAVAGRIQLCVRANDSTARLGGDEFAVLLHDSPVEVAESVGQRIIAALREPFRLAGRDIFIGSSIGVAVSRDDSDAPDELLNQADVAMYRAKKNRPGKLVFYEPFMHTEALDHLSLRGDLQKALDGGEFRLQYQPVFHLDTGEIDGVEALIRWHSPTRGLVPPNEFIPIAEASGIIVDIGQWVLETSAAQVASWRRDFPDLTLKVNISGLQLMHPRFADTMMRALTAAGLPAGAVTLELTESVLRIDPDKAVAALGDLRALGVRLSIDDFGTGYSSLAHLRELPVHELKIDQAFIARAELTVEDLAMVRTIVQLGQILGLRVVAEGIENEAQLAALRTLGCAFGQGYHLCRPTDAADLPSMLKQITIRSSNTAAAGP